MTLRGLLIAVILLFATMALAVFAFNGCSLACDTGSSSSQDHSPAGDKAGPGDEGSGPSSQSNSPGPGSPSSASQKDHDGNGMELRPISGPTLCDYWPDLFWCPVSEGE